MLTGRRCSVVLGVSPFLLMWDSLGQQRSTDSDEVTGILRKVVDLGLPVAVWFSVDVHSHGQARGLFDEDGTLRPNGEAFRRFLIERYS